MDVTPGELVCYVKERMTIGIVIATNQTIRDNHPGLRERSYNEEEPINVVVFISNIGLHWTRQRCIERCQ